VVRCASIDSNVLPPRDQSDISTYSTRGIAALRKQRFNKQLMRPAFLIFAALCLSTLTQHIQAQTPDVDPRLTYQRLICVVPMTGTGTADDPRRPKYVPAEPSRDRTGILAWNSIATFDGAFAIVEFVAADQSAFRDILADKSIKVFRRGKNLRDEIEVELKKWRGDIDFEKFFTVAQ
jgi:hypothetical protein